MQYLKRGDRKWIQSKQLNNFTKALVSTLDLHHHIVNDAFHEFCNFIQGNFYEQNRFLQVITGKGSAENPAIINSEIETWINRDELRPMVLFFDYEKNNHGCFQIILRKNRDL